MSVLSTPTPDDLGLRLRSGLLSFPVTHFTSDLKFDEVSYREHLGWQCTYPVAGLFAAGGTGEFFSLTAKEVDRVVRVAVDEVAGKVPVLAPAGGSTRDAIDHVQCAEEAGASGVLLFPPYLTETSRRGLAAHVEAVCAATGLGVVLYNRGNARYDVDTLRTLTGNCANIVGFKDGTGDVEAMTKVCVGLGDRLTYIGGVPTAEVFALPYAELGVSTYSSAIFNFAPDFALDFYNAVRARDRESVTTRLRAFVLPYLNIRDRESGYAVSAIKAGLDAVGRHGGPVRPPLNDLSAVERAELRTLVHSIGAARTPEPMTR